MSVQTKHPPVGTAAQASQTMLTLLMGTQKFAISTDLIREIIDPVPFTRVPGAAAMTPAVLNVRGAIIPLAYLHIPLNLERLERGDRTRIIVVQVPQEHGDVTVGLYADAVLHVGTVAQNRVTKLADTSHNWPADLIAGLFRDDGDFVLIPDLETIFANQRLRLMASEA